MNPTRRIASLTSRSRAARRDGDRAEGSLTELVRSASGRGEARVRGRMRRGDSGDDPSALESSLAKLFWLPPLF